MVSFIYFEMHNGVLTTTCKNAIDIESWYDSMPRSVKAEALAIGQSNQHQSTKMTRIDQYYASSHCIVCRKVTNQSTFFIACSDNVSISKLIMTFAQVFVKNADKHHRKLFPRLQVDGSKFKINLGKYCKLVKIVLPFHLWMQ